MPPLVLPETCDRAATKALYHDLCDAMGTTPLSIDASHVSKVGQAMLQLLVSAQRSEGGIAIEKASSAFNGAVKLAGLQDVLGEETKP
ncbi:MAG: STAS domain-containing protein [Pseudomonadota bacterium]